MTHKYSSHSLAAALFVGMTASSFGAGFQLAERSGSGLGRAYSGEAAIADDASIIASNPAGMSLLDDMSFASGMSVILPSINAAGIAPDGIGGFVPNTDNNIAADGFVPYMYLTKKINDQWTVGFGSYTTYGLKSNYSADFAAKSGTDFSELFSFNLNPSISYRLNSQWSFGAGINFLYADGTINSRTFAAVPGAPAAAVGSNLFNLEGDDWGIGYNLGVLFEVSERTRLGLHYRSAIDLSLTGSSDVGPVLGAGAGLGGPGALETTLDVELPDTLEFSAYHELNDQWAIHGDVLWTGWSKFQELAPKTGNPVVDNTVYVEENWSNAFRFSAGTTYKYSDDLTLRAGVAYDESPVTDANRTLRIPDADRIWASIGLTYKLNECYNLDFGYTHVFADDAFVNFESLGGNERAFSGNVSGSVNLFALGVSGSF